jgi:type I restriction enzyme S subunit
MQTYEAYKETGIEWIGKIPKHWKIERVKDIVQLRTEKTSEKSEEKNYLELENIEQGTGRIIDFKDTIEVSSDITIFRKGDVLFGKLRPYLAKYWLADRDGKCTGEIIAFNCFKIESSFFKYFIGSPKFIELCTAVAYGAKMPRVDWTRQIAYFYIAFPTPTEQTAIAQYLDQATKQIDKAIEIKTKQLEKLETYKKSKIHETVTKGIEPNTKLKPSNISWIGEIPEHWKIKRIKDIATLQSGNNLVSEQISEEGEYPVYGGNGLRGYYDNYNREGFFALIGRQGALCGNINYAKGKFWTTEHAVVVEIFEGSDMFWFGEVLREMNLNQYSNTAAQPGLAVENLRSLKLPFPPRNEQKVIAAYLDNFCKNIENAKENIEKQLIQLKKHRKSLIHECVTGKRKIA